MVDSEIIPVENNDQITVSFSQEIQNFENGDIYEIIDD